MSKTETFGVIALVVVILGLITLFSSITFIDSHEFAYKYDKITGEISEIDRTGYVMNAPFITSVHTIDLRPMQVCISGTNRILNCKLIEFNKEGFRLFISWHGRADYQQGHLFEELLKGYAYDETNKYPFLNIVKELKNTTNVAKITADTTKIQ